MSRLSPAGVPAPGLPVRPPLWRAALASFLPSTARDRADVWLARLPLAGVLLLQLLIAVRLDNTAFQDEALYIHTGHSIIDAWGGGEALYGHPEDYFSGAPTLYPLLAAVLDSVGGLTLVRLFSVLCMLSATVAVYWATNLMLGDDDRFRWTVRPGIFAALVFSLSASVLFLTNFATFDAPAFTALAWAIALGVGSVRRPHPLLWAGAAGLLCALAVLLKYSSAIDVPFVLATILVTGWRVARARALGSAVVGGLVCLAALAGSVLTWARPLLTGLGFTTTQRSSMIPQPPAHLVSQVLSWDGAPLLLILAGALVCLRRRPVLVTLLVMGTLAAPAAQIRMGEATSLHKHVVLGLVIGAPLAGAALARLWRTGGGGALAAAAIAWATFLFGASQANTMYGNWPDTTALRNELAYSIDAMPWIRMVGDTPEPVQYALQDRTQNWQWTSTYEGSFFYKDKSGVDAYRAALDDNYFQLAYLDGSQAVSAELMDEMASFGFKETSVVRTPYTDHAWHIWQRFEKLD
ncbi:ArnT family glycosyltransferase [Kineosporia succinea]|uniref:4-amino-4-deoxy-L-arabinose transferase-like glycosyltransferase n=1 Tax=Kineosporia succinea TaxID=84632 RepID=A0ABT9PA22_9ACTN|nr:hypothetical protein [Kineosporia succinea]MDP9829035.1 4-amino-4-deoxy-L-arabinose transferase-like glycosyltransferase [Kineosporia succinea]